ncbi:MAG: BatA domain-containing protein [Bacteroidetes bacterium]|nr:BatA domain-containing protein [Bacteroidota bacterium]
MIFVNPLVLIGLAAAALPLLVHLFNFRRPKKLDYSSLALLHSLQQTTVQRVRIRNWLLLILRTLALCALVFVFARPTLVGTSGSQFLGSANVSVVLVLDATLSMMQRDAEGTRFAQAKAIVKSITESMDAADEVFMMRENAQYLESVNILEDLSPSYTTQSAASTIRQAAALLTREGTHFNKAVYYVGDLQEATLTDSIQTSLEENVHVMLIPVGKAETRSNVGITKVQVSSRIIDPGSPATIEATILNHGGTSIDDYVVSLYLEGMRVAQTSVALPSGVPVRVRLQGVPETNGWISGYVMIEDDGFMEDNQRHFSFNVPERQDILLVHGSSAQTSHVELALSLGGESSSLSTTIIDQRELAATPFSQYSAIFLVGLNELTSGEVVKLKQYVQNGGGLLIFPGLDLNPVNTLLTTYEAGRVALQESETSIVSADFEHPLFEGVFTVTEREQRLESVRVYRTARYEPGIRAEQTLITLLGGIPLLQDIQFDQGRVLFLAVAPQVSWSDLPVRGLFVPLMYRAAQYLSAAGSVQGEQVLAGRKATIRIPSTQGQITLEMPDGTKEIPSHRQVFGASLIEFESNSPGIARILADNLSVRLVSVGLDPDESSLSYAEPVEARDRLAEDLEAPVTILQANSGEEIPSAIREARTGLELWRHFLVLGLLLLATEMILAARWKNP